MFAAHDVIELVPVPTVLFAQKAILTAPSSTLGYESADFRA